MGLHPNFDVIHDDDDIAAESLGLVARRWTFVCCLASYPEP